MAETGKITQIIGAVLDIKFTGGKLPEINEAIKIERNNNGGTLVVEVSQHLGDDTVRCIAMGPTDGLVRGMDAIATGAPITVPVGENIAGRLFDALGRPIDHAGEINPDNYWQFFYEFPIALVFITLHSLAQLVVNWHFPSPFLMLFQIFLVTIIRRYSHQQRLDNPHPFRHRNMVVELD